MRSLDRAEMSPRFEAGSVVKRITVPRLREVQRRRDRDRGLADAALAADRIDAAAGERVERRRERHSPYPV